MSAIEIRGLDHVVLRTVDPQRSMRFYCERCDPGQRSGATELGLYQLRAGAQLIDLIDTNSPLGKLGGAPAGPEARNMDHFAVQLAHFDEAAIRRHLESFGLEPGDVAERYGALGNGPSMYIHDPDGNVVELKGA